MSYSYTAEERIKSATWLRQLSKDMTHGDPSAAAKLLVAAMMIERQPAPDGPNTSETKDAARLDWLERNYHHEGDSTDSHRWVFATPKSKAQWTPLRDRIDAAIERQCATGGGEPPRTSQESES